MFINTPFAVAVGRSFVARIEIVSTGDEIELPCAVVSSNVGNDHSTMSLGMGVRFTGLSEKLLLELRALRAAGVEALDAASAASKANSAG